LFPVHRLTCALIRPWRANEVACTNSPHIFLFAYFVLHRQQLFTDEQKPAHEFCAKLGAVCRAACLHPADRWHQKRTVSTHFIPLRQCLPVNFMDLLPLLASTCTRCSEPCGNYSALLSFHGGFLFSSSGKAALACAFLGISWHLHTLRSTMFFLSAVLLGPTLL